MSHLYHEVRGLPSPTSWRGERSLYLVTVAEANTRIVQTQSRRKELFIYMPTGDESIPHISSRIVPQQAGDLNMVTSKNGDAQKLGASSIFCLYLYV